MEIYQNTTYRRDLICWDGFCKSLIECFWHVRRLAPCPSRGLKQADQLQCLFVFLITNVTFSLAHVNIAPSLQQQLSLNALKRNFALLKTVFKSLTSPHQNSIKKGRISFVWNPSSKIVLGKKVRLIAYIIVYFFCPMKNNGCSMLPSIRTLQFNIAITFLC